MLNEVFLIGRLGSDPEERVMQNGDKVVNFSLATSEFWKDQATGERKERTEWHRVVIFNQNLGKVATNYLRKGSQAYLQGKIRTRKWTDPNTSAERYATEIILDRFDGKLVLLGSNPQSDRHAQGSHSQQMLGNTGFGSFGNNDMDGMGVNTREKSLVSEGIDAEEEIFKDHIPF